MVELIRGSGVVLLHSPKQYLTCGVPKGSETGLNAIGTVASMRMVALHEL